MSFAAIQDVYDFSASPHHQPGDIWAGLPCYGLLGIEPITGVVISPACDLSNNKIETITYLPVISIKEYFNLPACLGILRPCIDGQLDQLGLLDATGGWPSATYELPDADQIQQLLDFCAHKTTETNVSNKEKGAIERVQAGLRLISVIRNKSRVAGDLKDVRVLLGSAYEETKRKIMTNSLRTETHFLPHDRQAEAWAGVGAHSLVLFRYPMTAPVSVFDLALDSSVTDWEQAVLDLADRAPAAALFSQNRPSKRSTVTQPFMADLLTRYLSVYLRLGSPDFAKQTIYDFSEDVEK